jgi:PAP2 superfamily
MPPAVKPGTARSQGAIDGGLRLKRGGFAQLYARVGLLLPMSFVALLGAGWLQYQCPELPGSYTWLQPYRVLGEIAESRGFPATVAVTYLVGLLTRWGPTVARARLTQWVSTRRMGAGQLPILLRVLSGLLAATVDVVWLPLHGPLDALALGVSAACLTRPWPREDLIRGLMQTAVAMWIFTTVCYWFTVLKALTFVGASAQDASIVAFEHAVTGIYPHRAIAAWAAERPLLVHWFDWAYFRIFEHMTLTAIFLVGLGNLRQRVEYLGALAICYFLGGPLYHLFPALGPVYYEPQLFGFLERQVLVVSDVQQWLRNNTTAVVTGHSRVLDTWSYIACMPSLHLAHECVMLYYARASKLAWLVSFAFSAFTTVAVLALGWHYPSDLLAGVLLAIGAIAFARWQSARLLPQSSQREVPSNRFPT